MEMGFVQTSCSFLSDLSDKSGVGSRSVLAGGSVPGWSPEVAVVLWRRILGCLGNVNNIHDVSIHEEVYEYLCDLVSTLVKVISASCHCSIHWSGRYASSYLSGHLLGLCSVWVRVRLHWS